MPSRSLLSLQTPARWRHALGLAAACWLWTMPFAIRAAEMSYDPAQRAILFNGQIQVGDEKRFEFLLLDHPPNLIIRSGGGQQVPAIAIARMVRERRMTVIVNGYCGSACAQMIFAAAAERRIRPQGFVAFHAGTLPMLEALQAELTRRVDGAASAPAAGIAALSNKADAMVRFGRGERNRFNADMGLKPEVAEFYERLTSPRDIDVKLDSTAEHGQLAVRQGAVCDWWIPDRAGLARLGLELRNDFEMMPRDEIAKGLKLSLNRIYFGPPLAPDDPKLAELCPAD